MGIRITNKVLAVNLNRFLHSVRCVLSHRRIPIGAGVDISGAGVSWSCGIRISVGGVVENDVAVIIANVIS